MKRAVVAIAIAVAAACGDSKTAGRTDSALPIVAATDTGTRVDCPVTGLWAQCRVLKRLEEMALAVHVESLTVVRERPLTIEGRRLPIARGELLFFIYADTVSRARDQAKLDKTQFVAAGGDPQIRRRTLLANQNLLAMLSVANGANNERITNALMAGPPQPPKPISPAR